MVIDLVMGHRQHLWIMNLVWPITALYAGPLALWAYFAIGRSGTHQQMKGHHLQGGTMQSTAGRASSGTQAGSTAIASDTQQSLSLPSPARGVDSATHQPMLATLPKWQSVALATSHCGSGCTVGDIVAEIFLWFVGPLTLFGKAIFATWVIDYTFAFGFGIAFQYFTIKPMKNLTPGEALKTAIKVDGLSLTAWQIGMYGWMAIVVFVIFGRGISVVDPVFWFMMQIAMCFGFLTSYPVGWWLVSRGIKEPM